MPCPSDEEVTVPLTSIRISPAYFSWLFSEDASAGEGVTTTVLAGIDGENPFVASDGLAKIAAPNMQPVGYSMNFPSRISNFFICWRFVDPGIGYPIKLMK